MTDKIKKALSELDVNNQNHWTADGQPRIETVRMLAQDGTLSRDDIIAVAPEFNRTNAVLESATAAAAPVPQVTPTVASETPLAAAPAPVAAPVAAPVVQQGNPVVQDPSGTSNEDDGQDEPETELQHFQNRLEHLTRIRADLDSEIDKTVKHVDALLSIEAEKPKTDAMAMYKRHREAEVEQQIEFQKTFGDRLKALGNIPGSKSPLDKSMAAEQQRRRSMVKK